MNRTDSQRARWNPILGAALLTCVLASTVGPKPADAQLTLVPIATGLELPVYVGSPPGDRERLFIVEKGNGRILIFRDGALLPTPFLDIDAKVIDTAGFTDERGLLGLAFHPNFDKNGYFFVHYSDNAGDTVIERYEVSAGDPDVADPSSDKLIFEFPQPFPNHNGGALAFSPVDGYLYFGLGDGGAAGDPGNRAQDPDNLLGKMLRINVDTGAAVPFSIPSDNPFAGANDPGDTTRDEIWATGLRNPWRFSFDRETGDLYIGDVGQFLLEEVDIQPASSTGGENYGWRLKEGSQCFNPAVGCDPGGLTEPQVEYDHMGGRCAITGGHVYRGCSIPDLRGTYFYADFCSGQIWSLEYDGVSAVNLQERTVELDPSPLVLNFMSSFGEDGNGELYVVDMGTGLNGEIFKLVPGVDLPCQDAIAQPAKSKTLKIRPGDASASKEIAVKVSNGDLVAKAPAEEEIQLVALDGTCPAGTVTGPADFGSKAGSTQDRVSLDGGKAARAKIPVDVSAAAFTTVNRNALNRCAIRIETASPTHDPVPSNNGFDFEIQVRDRNDVELATTNETAIGGAKPIKLRIPKGALDVAKVARVKLENGDILPSKASPGHAITLAVDDGDCPPGTIEFADADTGTSGTQASVVVAGGKKARADIGLRVFAADFDTPSPRSPLRCVVMVTASGPPGDADGTNNTTAIPIDVLDKNDF